MAPHGPRVLGSARPVPIRAAIAHKFVGQVALAIVLKVVIAAGQTAIAHKFVGQEALAMVLKVLIGADQTAIAHQLGGREILAMLLKVLSGADQTESVHKLVGWEALAMVQKALSVAGPMASVHRSREHGPRERTEGRFRRTLAPGAMRPPQQGDARPAAAMAAHAGMTDPDE
jgi:hypothetical protein